MGWERGGERRRGEARPAAGTAGGAASLTHMQVIAVTSSTRFPPAHLWPPWLRWGPRPHASPNPSAHKRRPPACTARPAAAAAAAADVAAPPLRQDAGAATPRQCSRLRGGVRGRQTGSSGSWQGRAGGRLGVLGRLGECGGGGAGDDKGRTHRATTTRSAHPRRRSGRLAWRGGSAGQRCGHRALQQCSDAV